MNKLRRQFLSAATVVVAAVPRTSNAQHAPKTARGPILLTVSGLIGVGNRGPIDPALDKMMSKQMIKFDRAYAFDFAALLALPSVTIKPTLEYDNKVHTLRGPLVVDVMKACAVKMHSKISLFMRAVDGYAAQVSAVDVEKYRYIVATHIDGQPMALGGLGPLWGIYDADRFSNMVSKPVAERFVTCPWATYHIEVKES